MAITKKRFGTIPPGREVELYTISNRGGASVSISTLGCAIVSLLVPDVSGKLVDVALGYDTPEEYLERPGFIGVVVGRCANRIAGGRFSLNGVEYMLERNDGENSLHGGSRGFDKQVWGVSDTTEDSITLRYTSPDGEAGYPGALDVSLTYRFDEENALALHYVAESDKDTVCNLTHHCYFNLDGHDSATTDIHTIQVDADSIVEVGEGLIPTGELFDVRGSALDLNEPVSLGWIHSLVGTDPRIAQFGGLDCNYNLKNEGALKRCAAMTGGSGREMEVWTDLPGLQVYTSGGMGAAIPGKGGAYYVRHGAYCMETQYYPDSPNQPHFPSAVLRAGERYDHTTVFRFSAR